MWIGHTSGWIGVTTEPVQQSQAFDNSDATHEVACD